MNIQDAKSFASAVKILGSRSKGFQTVLKSVFSYGYTQATQNGNSSPLMVLRENLPGWVKPTGCSVKAMDDFVRDYCGFEFNRKTKSYKKIVGVNLRELPEQGAAFWDYKRDDSEKEAWNPTEALSRVWKRGVKEGFTREQLLQAALSVDAAFEEAEKGPRTVCEADILSLAA